MDRARCDTQQHSVYMLCNACFRGQASAHWHARQSLQVSITGSALQIRAVSAALSTVDVGSTCVCPVAGQWIIPSHTF